MGTRESAYRKELVDYFKKNLRKGYTTDSLKWALINQGYSRVFVEDAIKEANRELAAEAPLLSEKPLIKHEIIEEPVVETKKSWWKRLLGW